MKLTNNEIGAAVKDIRAFFEKSNAPHRDVLKICLVVEESLLRYQDKFGSEHEFQLYTRKFFGAPKIIIRVKGEAFSPLENNSDDETVFTNEVMQNLLRYEEEKTIYRYENGFNELISFSTRERRLPKIPGGSISVAIILAIIFSFIAVNFPPDVQKVLSEQIISPALSILVKLIVTVTVFMIFFSIVAGICAIEDVTMLNNIGSTVLGRFFLLDAVIVAITFAIGEIFFPVTLLTDKNAVDLSEISTMLLSFVPTNILEAFLKGNVLQVTVMAFVVGICIIKIGRRISNVKNLVAELNFLMFNVVEAVFSMIPLIIFLCIFKTLLTSSLTDFFKVWEIIAAELIVYAIIIVLMLLRVTFKTKISAADFLKKISPAAIISLTTGSSVASLPKSLEISKESLHIEEKFCNFWIPLSLVLFSPSKLIQLSVAGFYVVAVSGETFSVAELFVLAFLAIQLSFASPNAAGGIVATFTLLLTHLNLPLEYVGTLMIADVLTGNLFTGLNVLVRQCEMMTVAHKMKFLEV